LLNRIFKQEAHSQEHVERIVFQVTATADDLRFQLFSELLESEGWTYDHDTLTLSVPKDVFSSGDARAVRAVHIAIAKMRHLMEAAKIDYDMRIISEPLVREKDMGAVKLKVGLIGDAGVGKTSLIRRFVLDQFDDRYRETIGAKVSKKEVYVPLSKKETVRVDMTIWDIAGDRKITELFTESHFKGMQGIIAVLDVTRRETLRSMDGWTSSVRHVAGDVPIYFLANKMDLQDSYDVGSSEVAKYSRSMGSPFSFASAKTGRNVERGFGELARWILSRGSKMNVSIAR